MLLVLVLMLLLMLLVLMVILLVMPMLLLVVLPQLAPHLFVVEGVEGGGVAGDELEAGGREAALGVGEHGAGGGGLEHLARLG